MSVLEEAIAHTKPSITIEIIKKHEAIRDEFEGGETVLKVNSPNTLNNLL
jgi:hypothetical protein